MASQIEKEFEEFDRNQQWAIVYQRLRRKPYICVFQEPSTSLTAAERAFNYRQKLKKDPKRNVEYKEKERERKKLQRKERTRDQILRDNLKSKERQKRYRERKETGITLVANRTNNTSKVLTRKEREKKREYWKLKKKESRDRQTSQRKRRDRERDLKNWHEKRNKSEEPVKKRCRKSNSPLNPENENQLDFMNKTSTVLQEIVQEDKKVKKTLIHKFSFLKKYGLSAQFSKYTGICKSDISKDSKLDLQRKRRRDATSQDVTEIIQEFMQRPDVSTNLPTAKRVKKDNTERRVLDKPLKTIYSDFKKGNPNIRVSLSTFKRNKPVNIESSRKRHWEGCLCEVCTNTELKLRALGQLATRKGSRVQVSGKYEATQLTMCTKTGEYNNKKCIVRQCDECGVDKIVSYFQPLAEQCMSEEITYTKWERIKRNVKGKEVVRTMPVVKKESFTQVVIELSKDLEHLAEHLFVASWQQRQFTAFRKELPDDWVILNMDFAENYSCVSQNEVQAAHWGHEQVTVHPTVAYYKCRDEGCDHVVTEALIFVSNDKIHDAHAVNSFMKVANKHLIEKRGLELKKQVQMTDGCSAQYKSKTPFADISNSIIDNGFPIERHFYGSRHGKGPSDGAGAVVKSFVRRGVWGCNVVVNNAEDFYRYAKGLTKDDKHSKRTLFLVNDIDRNRPERSNKKTLVGTRKLQCIKTIQKDQISTRNLSCFCMPCMNEEDGCLNSAYVDHWKTQDLETVGRTRGGRGGRGTNEARPRGVGVRTRGGRGGRGTNEVRPRGVGLRTRGGRGGRGTNVARRRGVGVRTRGGRGRRQSHDSSSDQENSQSSDQENSQSSDQENSQSSDQENSQSSDQENSTENPSQKENEEFSDLEDIGHISGLSAIFESLQEDDAEKSPIISYKDSGDNQDTALFKVPDTTLEEILMITGQQIVIVGTETEQNENSEAHTEQMGDIEPQTQQEEKQEEILMITGQQIVIEGTEAEQNEISEAHTEQMGDIEPQTQQEEKQEEILMITGQQIVIEGTEAEQNEISEAHTEQMGDIEPQTQQEEKREEILKITGQQIVIEGTEAEQNENIEAHTEQMGDIEPQTQQEEKQEEILMITGQHIVIEGTEAEQNENEDSEAHTEQMGDIEPQTQVEGGQHNTPRKTSGSSYNTGQFLRIAHGKEIYPAVVDAWPKVCFFQKTRCGWVEGTITHDTISDDVIGVLEPPDLSLKGSRIYYNFNDNKRKGDDASISLNSKNIKVDKEKKCSDLIVLGLPWKSTEEDLRHYFSKFGELLLVQVKRDPKSSQSKGYGFIRFGKYEDQIKCMSTRHNIDGRWCDVTIPNSNEGAQQVVSRKVFIARCTEDIAADDLRNYFSQFGEVVDVFIPKPFRSFAFVTFSEPEVAHSLCGEDHIVKGVSVHVSYAAPKGTDRYGDKKPPQQQNGAVMPRGGYLHQVQGGFQPHKNNQMNKPMGFPTNMPPQDMNMGINLFNSAMIAAAQAMLQGQAGGNWGHMAPPPQTAPPSQPPPTNSGDNTQQNPSHVYGATPAQTSSAWGWGHHQSEPQPGSYAGWSGSNRQQQGWS